MINVISCIKKSWIQNSMILIYQACTFCHNYVVFNFSINLKKIKFPKKYIYKVDVNTILLDQYKLRFYLIFYCVSVGTIAATPVGQGIDRVSTGSGWACTATVIDAPVKRKLRLHPFMLRCRLSKHRFLSHDISL